MHSLTGKIYNTINLYILSRFKIVPNIILFWFECVDKDVFSLSFLKSLLQVRMVVVVCKSSFLVDIVQEKKH